MKLTATMMSAAWQTLSKEDAKWSALAVGAPDGCNIHNEVWYHHTLLRVLEVIKVRPADGQWNNLMGRLEREAITWDSFVEVMGVERQARGWEEQEREQEREEEKKKEQLRQYDTPGQPERVDEKVWQERGTDYVKVNFMNTSVH